MDGKILVAYASPSGATQEIAEKISAVFQQADLQVDLCPVRGVQDLTPYRAVILGCAVYVGSWPKEVAPFFKTYKNLLMNKPVWIFSSGPTGEGDPVKLLNGWRLPAAMKPVVDQIQPRDITVFHGYINPKKLNAVQRWTIKNVVKKPFGDYRDWEAILKWTETIANTVTG
jgi:menaquinone-dependent protoporphyrinogen oxidase